MGLEGAEESSESEDWGGCGEGGNVGVEGRAERSSAERGRGRGGVRGVDGEGGKVGVEGTLEKSSSEIWE